MGIRFLIDSASDILQEEATALGISCIPMQIAFGDTVYEDGKTLSHPDFYEKLAASDVLPVTTQINPAVYEEYYQRLTADGDELVVITLSSQLSGTYQSACIAAADFPGKVYVVDSLNAAIGERILLQRGLELAKQELSAEEIARTLDTEKEQIRLVAMIETLDYLKKGGRISATVAFAGNLLGIKPAIAIKDGAVAVAGKARGGKQSFALLQQLMENAGTIDWDRPAAMVYSVATDNLDQFIAHCPELQSHKAQLPACSLGGTIGTHIGPGAYGIAFFTK